MRLWTGYHFSHVAAPNEIEGHIDGTIQTFPFHVVCQAVWQLECALDDYLKKHP